jgi:Tfp pilus assembly protein PilN
MKPVNLLPQSERAVRPAEGLGGSSYVVLGVLGVLLLAVVAFVFTQNQVNDRGSQIAKAQAEAQQAEQRASSLGAFGSFAAVKTQREQSVRQLAKARFDWERFMRELALVLPTGTSLLDVGTSTDPNAAPGAGATSSTTAPAPAPTAGAAAATPGAGPKAQLTGCAVSQKRVATLLVRLGSLHRAADVELKESAANDAEAGDGASQDSAVGGGSNTGCPTGKFKFDVTVSFAPAKTADTDAKPRKTPARLGGGA